MKKRDFGQYSWADHYAPIVNLGIGWMAALPDYDLSLENRKFAPVAEPILGTQIPIYYYSDENKKMALSVPISFSVWFDYTETRTSPILNTDYRFAVIEFNYSQKTRNSKLKNIGFRIIPFFHESTHIGDELLLNNFLDSIPRARINVSYEAFDLSVLLNDAYGEKIKNHSLRIGARILFNSTKGYYTVDSLESSPGFKYVPSNRWAEPYLQYQYQNPDGWLSNKKMMFVFSTDLSLRVRYGYSFYLEDSDGKLTYYEPGEAYHFCSNNLIGWKFLNSKNEVSDVGIFIKLYMGINPHGQFRNIPLYPWCGINIIYDL